MAWALLSVVAAAAVSAFVPATPIEPYLLGMVTAGDQPPLPVSVAAAVGQTAGKVVIFLGTRAALRADRIRRLSAWVVRRYSHAGDEPPRRRRWRWHRLGAAGRRLGGAGRRLATLLDRPGLVAPTVLLSSVVGVPPLLVVSVHAARTRISAPVFALCCLAGRTVRFFALVTAPSLLPHAG
jgi:membrane protein YqaA with SNARE-associated domain